MLISLDFSMRISFLFLLDKLFSFTSVGENIYSFFSLVIKGRVLGKRIFLLKSIFLHFFFPSEAISGFGQAEIGSHIENRPFKEDFKKDLFSILQELFGFCFVS